MDEGNVKSSKSLIEIIKLIKNGKRFLILGGILIAFILVIIILAVLIVLFDAAENDNNSGTCTANKINITGTISGSKVNLRIASDTGIYIENIKGTVSGDSFIATRKMTEKESQLLSGDNETVAWNYFRTKGYTEEATAAILGNLKAESGLDPTRYQDNGGPGRGIAQWTVTERWVTLKNYCSKKGMDPWSMECQIEFVDYEIFNGQMRTPDTFKSSVNLDLATEMFCDQYERPGTPHLDNRKKYAKEFYKKYSGQVAIGDIELNGVITNNFVQIEGIAGELDINTTGSINNKGYIDTTGFLGDTSGCIGANACGFSMPLGDKQSSTPVTSVGCVPRWGTYHCGDDFGAQRGDDIYAITAGTVVDTHDGCSEGSSCSGYGNYVVINHGDIYGTGRDITSVSGHMQKGSVAVKKGDTVTAGQIIGRVGSTGNSTGPHLHFELNDGTTYANKSDGCKSSLCYGKSGGIYSILKTLEEKVTTNCESDCTDASSATKKSNIKVIKKITKSDVSLITKITGQGAAITPQSLSYNGKNYIISYMNSSETVGRLVVYNKNGKRLNTYNADGIKHANGSTYHEGKNKILVASGYGSHDIRTFNGTSFNNNQKITLPVPASGIAYDKSNGYTYTSGGNVIYVLDSNFKKVKQFSKKRWVTAQDIGAYKGIVFVIVWEENTNNSHIDMYRVSDSSYIGTYDVNLGELESLVVVDGKMILLVNDFHSTTDYLYKVNIEMDLTTGKECSSKTGSEIKQKVVAYAKEFVGKKYKSGGSWNGEKPYTQTDCSGFVQGVYKHVTGVKIGRGPDNICYDRKNTQTIGTNSLANAQPGDIICYVGTNKWNTHFNHVAIYLGDNKIIDNTSARGISIRKFDKTRNYTVVKYKK